MSLNFFAFKGSNSESRKSDSDTDEENTADDEEEEDGENDDVKEAPSAPSPEIKLQSSPTLTRADSFRVSGAAQEAYLASQIAGMIGSGSALSSTQHHSRPQQQPLTLNSNVNGNSNGNVLVNGSSLKGRRKGGESRDSSPKPDVAGLTKEELRSVRLRNQNMRQMIYKEVKRPGRNHDRLFAMLKDLHGPRSVRIEYIGEIVQEAKRFKRHVLADLLTAKTEELVAVS